MESDSSYQPISTRFSSFKIKASDDVKDLAELKSIQDKANKAIATLRTTLRAQVLECAKLEAKTALSALQKAMADAIMNTVAIFCVEAKTDETHAPGIACHLIKSGDPALTKYLSLTNDELLNFFAAEYNIDKVPETLSSTHDRIRSKASSAILATFVNSWSTYLQQEEANDIAIKINKKAKLILTSKATDDAAMVLDKEESVSRENLEELISKRTAAEVKRQMNALKSSLKDNGGNSSSAHKNKKGQGKGKGKGADEKTKDTGKSKNQSKKGDSKKKQSQKKNDKNKGNDKSSQKSRAK